MKHIHDIGTNYNVISKDGNLIKVLRIIPFEDILTSAIGEYSFEYYGTDFDDYISTSKSHLSGFPEDPNSVTWHTTTEHEYDIVSLVEDCVNRGYDYVILEIIEEEIDSYIY